MSKDKITVVWGEVEPGTNSLDGPGLSPHELALKNQRAERESAVEATTPLASTDRREPQDPAY
jgi:hypothetical protein